MNRTIGTLLAVLAFFGGLYLGLSLETPDDSNELFARLERCTLVPGEKFEIFGGQPCAILVYDDPETSYPLDLLLIHRFFSGRLFLIGFTRGDSFYVYNVEDCEIRCLGKIVSSAPRRSPSAPSRPEAFL
ncbi:MAG: hypothetical protein AAB601_00680 [Patescibacteria group bacterium]